MLDLKRLAAARRCTHRAIDAKSHRTATVASVDVIDAPIWCIVLSLVNFGVRKFERFDLILIGMLLGGNCTCRLFV